MEFIGLLGPIFFVFILWVLLTHKGKNVFISSFMGRIVKDYGVIGKEKVSRLFGIKIPQETRLLKMKKGEETFFVLEANFFGAVQYMKLSDETVRQLKQLLEEI